MSGSSRSVDIGAAWRDFPVAQVPRPIVFLDSAVHIGDQGFVDGDAKMAWSVGAVTSEVALPDGVIDLILEGRSRSRGPRSLVISNVEQCEDRYWCDRGPRRLSAYRLTVSGLNQPCTVIDPDIEFWWPPRGTWGHVHAVFGDATVAEDEVTIHFPAFGGVLTEFHRAEFVEYPTFVVGRAITSERQAPPGTAIPAMGIRSMVAGRLARPLDGRVLVFPDGTPLAVLQEGSNGASA